MFKDHSRGETLIPDITLFCPGLRDLPIKEQIYLPDTTHQNINTGGREPGSRLET
jgi:hypothetical protein